MAENISDADPAPDLESLVELARKAADTSNRRADPLQAIAFFDLSGSTDAKLRYGSNVGIRSAMEFTSLASSVSARFGGRVIKTLGDGALACFEDPLAACRAALNLRHATHELLDLEMTAGLTAGRPQRITLDADRYDLLGDVIDRAARIQSLAFRGQVLIDGTLYAQVRSEIVEQDAWRIDDHPREAYAKGIGPLRLYELSLTSWRPKKQLATPFVMIADGRPTLAEKLALMREAKSEIIEIGIGLTSFAQYFTGQKPEEFRDPIRRLIRGGVNFKCFALDAAYEPGMAWLNEQQNRDYAQEAQIAKGRIEQEARFCRDESYRGRMSYHAYRRVPEFWCLGVDVDDPVDGRMFFASYLPGVARSAMPVIQLSQSSSPELFEKYLSAVRELRAASTEPKTSGAR